MDLMRTFIIRGAAFLAIIFALLLGLTALTDAGLRRTGQDDYIVWNELISGAASSNIIINGNSHAASQIDPLIIGETLGCKAFNIGLDGQDLDLQLMRYATYRHYNKKPRAIIQVMDFHTLKASTRLLNRPQYLPYLSEDNVYHDLHPIGISFWDRYLPILKYRGLRPIISLGINEYFGRGHVQSARSRGFLPRNLPWDAAVDTFIKYEHYYFASLGCSPSMIDTARRYLATNRQEGIRTIIITAPQYYAYTAHFPNRRFYWACIAQEAQKYGAVFLNFQEDELSFDKGNFSNATHLNAHGSMLFSQKLALAVKQVLAEQPQ